MARTIKALATPKLLRWARQSAGFDVPTAAKKIGQEERRIEAWEAGREQPSVAQLRKAAEVYKRPLAVFYLAEPPTDFTVLRDFRRLRPGIPKSFSPRLRYLIRRVIERQEWAAQYRGEHGAKRLSYVGSETLQSEVAAAAQRGRRLLRVSLLEQQVWHDPGIALRHWIARFEAAGLLVFQSSNVPTDEMRGFAVPDQLAPAVLINSKDTRSARIFTLAHEFAHILLAVGGVSNLRVAEQPESDDQKIEVFCNLVAAEMLVPLQPFVADVETHWGADVDEVIRFLARRYAVSREVVARRLLELGRLSKRDYEERRSQYIQEAEATRTRQREEADFGIPYSRIVVRNNGHQFTREILGAYSDGEITARDLSTLLDVQLRHVARIEFELFSSRWKGATTE